MANNTEITYDNGCHCDVQRNVRKSSWSEIVTHYNHQSNSKVIERMDLFWNFADEKKSDVTILTTQMMTMFQFSDQHVVTLPDQWDFPDDLPFCKCLEYEDLLNNQVDYSLPLICEHIYLALRLGPTVTKEAVQGWATPSDIPQDLLLSSSHFDMFRQKFANCALCSDLCEN
jgi:hypothetical protein